MWKIISNMRNRKINYITEVNNYCSGRNKNLLLKKIIITFVVGFLITTSSVSGLQHTNENERISLSTQSTTFKSTGYFYVTEDNGIWWFIDPNGEKFYSLGMAFISVDDYYYGNISDWVTLTQERLDDWGFNTLNGGDTHLFPSMPYIYKFKFKHLSLDDEWPHQRHPDVFDPEWQILVQETINSIAPTLKNDSRLIGYQTDNEMKWGPDYLDDDTLLEAYLAANYTTPGKQRAITFLRIKYDNNTAEFNRAWKMNINSFDELNNHRELGRPGWAQRIGKAKRDIDDFSQLVAHTYFSFMDETLHNADPNHLNFGIRFLAIGVPDEVLEECGKYVDVINVNYYRMNTNIYDPQFLAYEIAYDNVPLDQWIVRYHQHTGRPILISEYSLPAKDSIWPIRPPVKLIQLGIIITSIYAYSQEGRADLFEWYAMNCLTRPYFVGQIWFAYRDKLNVVNWGIVNMWDEPYEPLIQRIIEINKNAIAIHSNASIDTINHPPITVDTNKITQTKLLLTHLRNIITNIEFQQPHKKRQSLNEYSEEETISYLYPINTGITYYVGGEGPGNYSIIQEAINQTTNGDTVYVYNGTYEEELIITTSINLIGENKFGTKIIGNFIESAAQNIVIIVQAENVFITGFNITGAGGYYHDDFLRTCSGISIDHQGNCTIINNYLHDLGDYGVRLRQSHNTHILKNFIERVLNKIGSNILIDSSNHVIIEENEIYRNTICGIWLSRSRYGKIKNNIISSSLYTGIIFERVSNTRIKGNHIINNQHIGLLLRESHDNIIEENNIIRYGDGEKIYNSLARRLAYFYNSTGTIWYNNYWDKPLLSPRIIIGKEAEGEAYKLAIQIDNNPSSEQFI
jgi:parallel beta-helix repeat protein